MIIYAFAFPGHEQVQHDVGLDLGSAANLESYNFSIQKRKIQMDAQRLHLCTIEWKVPWSKRLFKR